MTRSTLFSLSDSSDAEWFAYLADHTRALWERHGYRVHVQTNQQRIVITTKPDESRKG